MRIDQANGESKPLAVTFGTSVLNVEYHPSTFTVEELVALKEDRDNPDRIIGMIRRTVTAWDLTDNDDQPIPISAPAEGEPDLMRKLVPIPVFSAIIAAVRKDSEIDSGESSPSDAS